jgi:starch phosphorylase
MLLSQPERLVRLLSHPARPVQLIIAGKAHPRDDLGRSFVQRWARFVHDDAVRARAVFLEDYDMALAEQLVQGVDVWVNTPRRPWEASGTSGMKILVNGGLNLSERDGWWAEAYSADVGWALGDGQEHAESSWDAVETDQLFSILENEVVPQFYERDSEGIPRAWVARIRASLAKLTPMYSSNRMLADYLDQLYVPAAEAHWARTGENLANARELSDWYRELRRHWQEIHWGNVDEVSDAGGRLVRVQVYLGEIPPDSVRVQLYAESGSNGPVESVDMRRDHALSGAAGGFLYLAQLPPDRASRTYTPRVVAFDPRARVPAEANFIRWYPG